MSSIWFGFVGFLEQILVIFAVLVGSFGIGIILFTICVRLLILPLTLKSIRSNRKLQEVQPQFKELQRKYGKDQKKLQEETVKLYKEYKVNPVGGCLPMLLQLPIFLGVWQAISHLMVPGFQDWLGPAMKAAVLENDISQLTALPVFGPIWEMLLEDGNTIPVLLNQTFLGIDLGLAAFPDNFSSFSGIPYLILPVLAVFLQFIQQLMAMPRVQDPQQQMMTRIMLFMPLFFAYIALTFPVGVALYWLTTSVVGIVQQYFISGWGSLANHLKFLPPDTRGRPAPAAVQAAATSEPAANQPMQTSAQVAGAGAGAAVASRPTFWDVMQPLTEPESTGSAEDDNDDDYGHDETEQDSTTAHDQAKPLRRSQAASRRHRRRRS